MENSEDHAAAERRAISFPNWKQMLAETRLNPAQRMAFIREILAFLHHCKAQRAPATIALARTYLAAGGRPDPKTARDALRWFAGRGQAGDTPAAGSSSAPIPQFTDPPLTASSPAAAPRPPQGGVIPSTQAARYSAPSPAAQDQGNRRQGSRCCALQPARLRPMNRCALPPPVAREPAAPSPPGVATPASRLS